MNDQTPSREEWIRLFEAMIQIKELAPWQWMEESDLFGVQDPETGAVHYVSVMGQMGEHLAVSAYLGAKGLTGFWALHEGRLDHSPESYLLIPQLQASFEDRDVLSEEDRKLIKYLGYKFRGRQSWPLFRSHRPACVPWPLEASEARLLSCVLEQVLEVAPRFRADQKLLRRTRDESYLVRVASQTDGAMIWEDRRMKALPSPPSSIVTEIDIGLLDYLKALPRTRSEVEIAVTILPAPVRETGSRPFFPFIVLVAEARSGMIVGHEMLDPRPGMEAMWGQVIPSVAQALARYRIAPQTMKVGTLQLEGLLQPLAAELGCRVKLVRDTPAVDEALESLFAFMR